MRQFFSMIACCFNWKVAAGLGIVAIGIGIAQPGMFLGVLPTLIFLICPLSMGLMAISMWRNAGAAHHVDVQNLRVPSRMNEADSFAAIQANLSALQERQAALAEAIAALEQQEPGVVMAAESIVRHVQEPGLQYASTQGVTKDGY